MKLTNTVVCTVIALSPAAALAGDDPAATATSAAAEANSESGTPPPIFKQGAIGLSIGVPATSTSDTQVNLAYFKDSHTAYDLFFGFDFAHTPDMMAPGMNGMPPTTTPGGTKVGLSVGAGYRMYKRNSERIHTYLEPFAQVASADLGSVSDNLMLGVGGALGAECMFTDWFSVRGQVGVALTVGSTFKAIELATSTSGLYANFYWD